MTNAFKIDTLILTEVQLEDYFGEDDIVRYFDKYGRKQGKLIHKLNTWYYLQGHK